MAITRILSGITMTDTIGSATADAGNTGVDDATSGGTFSGDIRSVYEIEIESTDAIGTATVSSQHTGTFTSLEDGGSGKILATSASHGLRNGDSIEVSNTTNYNGTYTVSDVSSDTFKFTDTYVSDEIVGTWTTVNDITSSGTYTGTTNSTYTIEIAGEDVGEAVFTGSGLDDMQAGGTNTGNDTGDWIFEIQTIESGSITAFADAGSGEVTITSASHGLTTGDDIKISGTTNYNGEDYSVTVVDSNSFKVTATWVSDDATGTWEKQNEFTYDTPDDAVSSAILITGAEQTVHDGVTVTFGSKYGHTAGDYWTVSMGYGGVMSDSIKWRKDDGSWTTTIITGTTQTIAEGVSVAFTGTKNHKKGDSWTIAVQPDNFKWKVQAGPTFGSYTTGVAITGSAQTLDSGVTITFTGTNNHTVGDKWTITVDSDLTLDMSSVLADLQHRYIPEDYEIGSLTLRIFKFNLITGAVEFEAIDDDGNAVTITSADQLYSSAAAVSTQEQSDLDSYITSNDPGDPDYPAS